MRSDLSGTLPSPREGLGLAASGCEYPIQVELRYRCPSASRGVTPAEPVTPFRARCSSGSPSPQEVSPPRRTRILASPLRDPRSGEMAVAPCCPNWIDSLVTITPRIDLCLVFVIVDRPVFHRPVVVHHSYMPTSLHRPFGLCHCLRTRVDCDCHCHCHDRA